MKTISIEQLQDLLNQSACNLIDVREIDEYTAGHVPGAVNIPLSMLEDRVSEIDLAQEPFIICRSGSRSARAVEWLATKGIAAVNVEGGTLAWSNELEK